MSRSRTCNLADLYEVVAGCVPDRTAFRCGSHSLTFRELDQRANRFGSALRARGFTRGDHVGIQLYNSVEYLEAFLGCCKIGAVPINVNYRYVSEELRYLFKTLDLKGLVYGAEFEAEVAATVPHVPTLRTLLRVKNPSVHSRAITLRRAKASACSCSKVAMRGPTRLRLRRAASAIIRSFHSRARAKGLMARR